MTNDKFTEIPFDDIVSFGQRTLLYYDLFTVSWLLGRFCNYQCSYCWPYARSNIKDHRPTEICLTTITEIKRQARENSFNSFHFSFSGGEPTFHPGYLDILKHLADDVHNTNYTSIHMTSNCSRNMSWFKQYVENAKPFHRASITASLHSEHVNTPKKMQDFADKLIFCQENDVQVTINMVMVPEWFEKDWNNALFFHEQGINVTLKPQSDPTASRVVDGYTSDMLDKLHNGMPQQAYTEIKRKWNNRPTYQNKLTSPHLQVELTDSLGKKWYIDQAERFNAFNFNKFKGWKCNAGYQGIIIREPDGEVKRGYSCHDELLGNIETGFKLFNEPTTCVTQSCISSADSKLPKFKVD
jgi:organic radical activating enzyme